MKKVILLFALCSVVSVTNGQVKKNLPETFGFDQGMTLFDGMQLEIVDQNTGQTQNIQFATFSIAKTSDFKNTQNQSFPFASYIMTVNCAAKKIETIECFGSSNDEVIQLTRCPIDKNNFVRYTCDN